MEDPVQYRKSFGYYSEKILLAVFVFCGVLTVSLFAFLSYMYRPYALYSTPIIVILSYLVYAIDLPEEQRCPAAGNCGAETFVCMYLRCDTGDCSLSFVRSGLWRFVVDRTIYEQWDELESTHW